jgi:hypothetical protein
MSLSAAVGSSNSADAREAGLQAARQALDQLGRGPVVFGWLIVSHTLPVQQALSGAADLLGDAPLLGFSTSAELTDAGRARRSVVVALLSADDVQARAGWWPDFVQDSRACTQNMLKSLQPDGEAGELLLTVADGLGGDASHLCAALSSAGYPVAGCLAGGELWRGRTYQVGGRQQGSGGLAGAVLSGNVVIGVGSAHGWQPVGALTRLTRVQGQWVRMLDNQPANEVYAHFFGYPARLWAYPPLSEMVRLYPLGIQESGGLLVRSPLRVEVDGSLRMNTVLPEGRIADLLVGSQDSCLEAARQAVSQALTALGPTRPRLAVVLVDAAWQTMLELNPQAEVQAVRQALGGDAPIVGGYTFGQIAPTSPHGPPQLLNQHMTVILFGVKKVEVNTVVA